MLSAQEIMQARDGGWRKMTQLYLLEGTTLLDTFPSHIREVLQTPENALANLAMLEETGFDETLDPYVRFHILCCVLTLVRALGEAEKELKTARALVQITRTADTLFYLACALRLYGKNEEAIKLIEECERLRRAGLPAVQSPGNVKMIKYALLRQLGRWDEASAERKCFELFGLFSYVMPDDSLIKVPWRGEPTDKEVAVVINGGYGDLIFYSRLLPLIQKIAPRAFVYLHSMKKGSPPTADIEAFLSQQGLDVRRECDPDTPMTTIIHLSDMLNLSPTGKCKWSESIPVFKAKLELIEKFRYLRHPDKPTLGICWKAGGTEPGAPGKIMSWDFYRVLTEEQVSRIIEQTPNINWVNLQYDEPREGITNLDLVDWQQTAAIVENLDGILTVDTGVMNLACAMGKPTYILLGGLVDHKFANRVDKCPYYPSSQLYRNNGFGYDKAIERVIKDLKKLKR